jgi:hypothetical protein
MLIVCIEILSSTGLSRSHQETAISNCEIGNAYWLWKVVNGAHYLLLYVLQQQWHVVSLLLHLFEVLRCQKLMQTYVCHVLCYLYVDHHIIILLNLLWETCPWWCTSLSAVIASMHGGSDVLESCRRNIFRIDPQLKLSHHSCLQSLPPNLGLRSLVLYHCPASAESSEVIIACTVC